MVNPDHSGWDFYEAFRLALRRKGMPTAARLLEPADEAEIQVLCDELRLRLRVVPPA